MAELTKDIKIVVDCVNIAIDQYLTLTEEDLQDQTLRAVALDRLLFEWSDWMTTNPEFETWFDVGVSMRNLMIRLKNQQ